MDFKKFELLMLQCLHQRFPNFFERDPK